MRDDLLTENIELGTFSEGWTFIAGDPAGVIVAADIGVGVGYLPQQNVTTPDLTKILNTLERIEILLKEKNINVAQSTDIISNEEDNIELRKLTLSATTKALKSYIDKNPGTYMVSELVYKLQIHTSTLIQAIDKLIKSGDIENT